MRLCTLALATALLSCRQPSAGRDAASDAGPDSAVAGPSIASAASAAPPPASAPPVASAAAPPPASSAVAPPVNSDASDECRLSRGPLKLSVQGPALLLPKDGDFRVIFNREGAAATIVPAFPQLKPEPAPARSPLPGEAAPPAPERATWPACVAADRFLFCMDPSGSIRRISLAGEGEAPIAWGRKGSSMAAAGLPGGHTLIAFLADRKTTEGVVTQALAVLDDKPAVQLSEEGSGATFVTLAPWKDGALAVYIDARAALTPVHARAVSLGADGRLELGPDAVIFVGGGAETRMTCAVASAPGAPSFALVPTTHEVSGFGMAAVLLSDPIKDDAPAVWSMYPNGLTPAPIAATRGASPVRVARVRPASSEPGARRVLELGRLNPEGAFEARCNAVESGSFSHVIVEMDRDATLWLAYTSSEGTWVEQRGGASRGAAEAVSGARRK